MTDATLERMFKPQTVAVVGASNSPQKPGHNIVQSLSGFPGEVFPVNPRDKEICGIKAYSSLNDIGKAVDLVVFAIPAKFVVQTLRDAEIDIGGCLIVTGGFNEIGEEGSSRQEELRQLCEQRGIRVIGPNTAGLMNPAHELFATFVTGTDALKPGSVGIVSQSGAINMVFSFVAHHSNLGISLAVGLGNMVDVSHDHVVSYLADDEQTDVILLYAEGIARGRELFDAVRRATEMKPVVALLVGKTDVAEFAASHTGNLIGSYALKKSALEQAGAVVVDTVMEAIDAAEVLSRHRLPPNPAPGIAVVTAQAGPGMLMMDVLGENGVDVPKLSANTVENIRKLLPPLTYIENPVDTGRPSGTFADILRTVSEDDQVDALLTFALDEPDTIRPQQLLGEVKATTGVPILFGTVAIDAQDTAQIINEISALGIPAFDSPERLAKAAVAFANDAKGRVTTTVAAPANTPVLPEPSSPVDEMQAKEFLRDLGFVVPDAHACHDHDQARQALEELPKPIVVKVLDAGITHKTDVGGVHLDIATDSQLQDALTAIDQIGGDSSNRRYLLEEMAPPGVDLILGARNDDVFGPVVLVGMGGIAAEAVHDVVMRLAPITPYEAREMISELQCADLLDGWRGTEPVDKDALVENLVNLGLLINTNRWISEMDLNPVRVNACGAIVLDAFIEHGATQSAAGNK